MSQNDKGPLWNVWRESHLLLNKGLICHIDRTWQGCSEEFAPFSFVISSPLLMLCTLADPCMCTHTRVWVPMPCLENAYVLDGPARPCCSVWCKLCMCKKHSIIRPSIIRGCQWALLGWYITLSCPLPQLGPAQPARHAGNSAGQMYSTERERDQEKLTFWHIFTMLMMPLL